MKIVKSKHTYPDGSYVIIYHKEGNKDYWHREGGPATIEYNKDGSISDESWWIDNKLHREDGPARTHYRKDGSIFDEDWVINDKPLSEDQINNIKRNLAFNKWLEQELDHEGD